MKTYLRPFLVAALLLSPLTALAANSGAPISADYVNILENRLAALEQQVQALTNQVEQSNYTARAAQDRVAKLEEDINTRFRMIESQAPAAPAAPSAAQAAPASPVPPTLNQMTASTGSATGAAPIMPDDANVAYDQAFSKIRDGDYEAAEVAMRAFLQRWPNIELSSNAAYWLGETFYVRGDFSGAAKSFAEAYQQYPKGAKAEDTLLKLALALGALNRTSDACITYDQLTTEFPRMSAANRRRVEQERTQLSCPAQQASSETSSSSTSSTRRSSSSRTQRH